MLDLLVIIVVYANSLLATFVYILRVIDLFTHLDLDSIPGKALPRIDYKVKTLWT